MKTFTIAHRVGSFYLTTKSETIKVKNEIQALRKAFELGEKLFNDNPNKDLRLVSLTPPGWEHLRNDKQKIERIYCVGLCKFKEHYFELHEVSI